MVTGVDLIREQILVALGHPLRLKQEDIKLKVRLTLFSLLRHSCSDRALV